MHVAIVGMGALGRVYGVRLALRAGTGVTFVVRPGRGPVPLRIQRIDGDALAEELRTPSVETRIPKQTDVVLVCVRAEQLDDSLDALMAAAPDIPIVMLTPLLPHDFERLTRVHGPRVRAGMPGVVAYMKGDICRYWLPKVAPTLIDAAKPVPHAAEELARALSSAGFAGRLELGVHETNPATTVSFIPLAMGIDAAGGIDALLGDRALLKTTLDAVSEGLALAGRIGRTPAWIDMLARFAGPMSLKIGIGLAKSRAPEALAYVEEHFGRKLHAQNVAMARSIVALADEKGTGAVALRALLGRLETAA
jgi:Ketopantoate reductase PanE/ApbA